MKYSLWNFRDYLAENGISLSCIISDNEARIERVRLGDPSEAGSSSCALIVDAGRLPDCSGFRYALCFNNDRILFPVASAERILNLSMNMMEHYNMMENVLHEQLVSGSGMRELLDQAALMTGFPLAYMLNDRSIVSHSREWDLPITECVKKVITKQLTKNQFSFPFYYISEPSSFTGTIVAKPLESGKKQSDHLLLYDPSGSLNPGDLHIFSAAADIIRNALMFQSENSGEGSHPLTDWYRMSLFDDQPPAVSGSILDQLEWNENDYYRIACISCDTAGSMDHSNLSARLSGKDCCCLMTPDGLSVLIHLGSRYPNNPGRAVTMLDKLCRKYGLHAGYSLPFDSLSLIREFYHQSVYALSLSNSSGEQKVRPYESFIGPHILNKCRSLQGTQVYIHPDIRLLSEIDENEKEPLLETLYSYLVLGRSASHAAQVLFIHRNTLHARLKKIQQHLSFPIEEYGNIGHILISLMIAGKNKT